MTRNIPSRTPRHHGTDAGTGAIPYARHRLQAQRALAALLLVATMWAAFAAIATAGEPAATAAAPATVVAAPMSQDTLLQHQAQHPGHLVVLDVRTPQEYSAGHMPGAVNVPYEQLASRLAEVPKDKDVVLYCKSGRRAGMAADVLAANGYTRLSHLEGDMNAWIERGRPIAKP